MEFQLLEKIDVLFALFLNEIREAVMYQMLTLWSREEEYSVFATY